MISNSLESINESNVFMSERTEETVDCTYSSSINRVKS